MVKIPWWEPQLAGSELARVTQVLDSNFLNDGDVTTAFEQRIAALFGAKHAVATTSGTTAIFLAVAAAGAHAVRERERHHREPESEDGRDAPRSSWRRDGAAPRRSGVRESHRHQDQSRARGRGPGL